MKLRIIANGLGGNHFPYPMYPLLRTWGACGSGRGSLKRERVKRLAERMSR